MATLSQAQLIEERDAVVADITDKTSLYNSMIAKGQINSAKELKTNIDGLQNQADSLNYTIQNYTQYTTDQATQDAAIASTANFEASTTNQLVTSSLVTTTTTTGGADTTIPGAGVIVNIIAPDSSTTSAQARLRASAYVANPAGRFGLSTIERAVTSGAITYEEGQALKAGTIPLDDRFAIANAAQAVSNNAGGSTSLPNGDGAAVVPDSTGLANDNVDSTNTTLINGDGSPFVTANPPVIAITSVDTELANGDGTITGRASLGTDVAGITSTSTVLTGADGAITAVTAVERVSSDGTELPNGDGGSRVSVDSTDTTSTVYNDRGIIYATDDTDNIYYGPTTRPGADPTDNPQEPDSTEYASGGTTGEIEDTRQTATAQDVTNFNSQKDWRVKLSLAPGADCLYKASGVVGILRPLLDTDGVIFPYTPTIQVNYAAHYDGQDITHSNYKIYQYKSSSVDSISITCDFTAQDTAEANYLLAVIHFFKSATKMFYGQDEATPNRGSPPPLCYITGLGAFQFDAHPLAISAFNYSLPNNVDYIRSGINATAAGVSLATGGTVTNNVGRSLGNGLAAGGEAAAPVYAYNSASAATSEPTYVPTHIQLQITAVPIVTRNDISNNFSLRKYATGELLQGSKRKGGIW